jgi:hypothetical protein
MKLSRPVSQFLNELDATRFLLIERFDGDRDGIAIQHVQERVYDPNAFVAIA